MDVLKTSLSLALKSPNRIVWGYAMLNVKNGFDFEFPSVHFWQREHRWWNIFEVSIALHPTNFVKMDWLQKYTDILYLLTTSEIFWCFQRV